MTTPGPRDIAHLGGLELFTNKFDESYWFFTELLAMKDVGREGDSAFLRTWDSYERWTIKLTPRDQSGVGNVSMRAASPEALDRIVASIEASAIRRESTEETRCPARGTRAPSTRRRRWTPPTPPDPSSSRPDEPRL